MGADIKISSVMKLFGCVLLLLTACGVNSQTEEDLVTCNYQLYPPADTVIASHNAWTRTHYSERITAFKQDTILPNSVIMLGNSLTELGGDWSNRLGIDKVVNRGIAGDNSDGVSARLGEIICSRPETVFIMIGTNDLWTNYTVEEIGTKIAGIGRTLAEALPESDIVVQTIMPLEKGHEMAGRLKSINKVLASFEGQGYVLIDTFKGMGNPEGALPAEFTTDGVHLTEEGYDQWVSIIKESLNN